MRFPQILLPGKTHQRKVKHSAGASGIQGKRKPWPEQAGKKNRNTTDPKQTVSYRSGDTDLHQYVAGTTPAGAL
jgi:hypothetical protein